MFPVRLLLFALIFLPTACYFQCAIFLSASRILFLSGRFNLDTRLVLVVLLFFDARSFSWSINFILVRLSFSLIRFILLAAYYCRSASSFRHANPSRQFIFIGLFLSPERNILAGSLLFAVLRLFLSASHIISYIIFPCRLPPLPFSWFLCKSPCAAVCATKGQVVCLRALNLPNVSQQVLLRSLKVRFLAHIISGWPLLRGGHLYFRYALHLQILLFLAPSYWLSRLFCRSYNHFSVLILARPHTFFCWSGFHYFRANIIACPLLIVRAHIFSLHIIL